MAFNISLRTNNSENNAVTKSTTNVLTLSGELKDATDIINPIFIFRQSMYDLRSANYAYISPFQRYYFVTDIINYRNSLTEIHMHVDVLMSFAAQIKANKGIVRRSESADNFNLYLNDGSLVAYQDPYILTEPFPNGFTGSAFVLAVAGA